MIMENFTHEKCGHCGAEYSNQDYDKDAEVWKCSNCKCFLKGGTQGPTIELTEVSGQPAGREAKGDTSRADFAQLKTYHKNPYTIFEILFSFKGRISRSTYWCFLVPYLIIVIVLSAMVGGILNPDKNGFFFIFLIISCISTFAVGTKRLHDSNRSGWFMLIAFIPIIAFLWLLILGFIKGTSGNNLYGPDPLIK